MVKSAKVPGKRGRPPNPDKAVKAAKPKGKPVAKKVSKPGQKPVGPAPAPAADHVSRSTTKLITQNDLTKLLRQVTAAQGESYEVMNSARSKIADAVENQHLHKGVFGLIRKLNKLEPERLATFMEHFDHYFIAVGLEARVDSVLKLPIEGGEVEADADADGEGEADGELAEAHADGPRTKIEPAGDNVVTMPSTGFGAMAREAMADEAGRSSKVKAH